MSVDATKLLFEGFLQKRKDTLKIRWVTYWFRLQNTTLFFYTKKNGSASNLKGYYYIYTLQSVREVQKSDRKRFMFEITMTNGKRKVLAAETEDLRKEWIGHLWQAMHLSSSGIPDSSGTDVDECEQRDRLNTSTPGYSSDESVMESLPVRPLSAPAPSEHIYSEARRITPLACHPEELNSEEAIYHNQPTYNYQNHNDDHLNDPQWPSGLNNEEARKDEPYDVLPIRKKLCDLNPSPEEEEGVYDVPVSLRRYAEHEEPSDSIYDVPSSLLRNRCDHASDEPPKQGTYWRI